MYARVVLKFVTLKNVNGVDIDNFPKGNIHLNVLFNIIL